MPLKAMKALAAVMVPAHGFVVGASGLTARSDANSLKSQVVTFTKSLIRGCLWAAAIAAGMLIYTAFTAKWKEKGYPTIPISALIAADQISNGMQSRMMPMSGQGGIRQGPPAADQTRVRQTSLLDMDEFDG
jgi:hypothetical protein